MATMMALACGVATLLLCQPQTVMAYEGERHLLCMRNLPGLRAQYRGSSCGDSGCTFDQKIKPVPHTPCAFIGSATIAYFARTHVGYPYIVYIIAMT